MNNNFFKHPNAIVEEGADIGKGTRIWAFAHVMKGAHIGNDCNIGNYAFVETGATLGNQVTLKSGVQVYEGVHAEDDVFIGPNSIFTNELFPRSFIKRPKDEWLKKTRLRKGCTIGAGAIIVCGNDVGEYAMVAAGSVVTKNIPPYALVMGVPARLSGWICSCGNKLTFDKEKATCSRCHRSYKKENQICHPELGEGY